MNDLIVPLGFEPRSRDLKSPVLTTILWNRFQQFTILNFIDFLKCCRHWDFPSGPPPQYQPSLKALNFGVRMGSGVFTLVWPTTKQI
ncbi:kinase domain protein, putative (macronuclear) [Tetrahymena thermophila SB210]|uniref:Kinase domain protein, putative n=1 Tax=Tetrahymena thermophila (strain SB210) TaxID=312017 RepID=W7WWG5_TETTS|nr:kinase domain protein, putative [Tetrahymena thermophila SB210]EWS71175.1 kinase domain protein, putative [Tetrahymena thermophila SB210]|eukprot:XP_012656273.1 kinase domain protein, putative [Tetrahymena thermophila SB210]